MGVIGLGQRGLQMLCDVVMYYGDVRVVAVCDTYADRAEVGADAVEKKYGERPFTTTDYRKLLTSGLCDAVYIATSWETHLEVAMEAMRNGVIVGLEVGCAYDIDQCYRFVRTYEETKTPCMMMENCCFGKEELLATALVRAGKLGTVVHCHGAYSHDLRAEISQGHIIRHYRLDNYRGRNTENYPTHELGPIARLLNINRGNRMLTLCTMSSKACGLSEYVAARGELRERDPSLADTVWNQGDVVSTIIKCANGETIVLTHDCSLYRPYSRGNVIQGTKGIYMEDKHSLSIQGMTPEKGGWDSETWVELDQLWDKIEHPLWKKFQEAGVKGGHGGMDFLVLRAFIEAIRDNKLVPIDVYDTASWMAITPLSEDSIAKGSAPVAIPDFTNGLWLQPDRPYDKGTYCLEEICKPGKL